MSGEIEPEMTEPADGDERLEWRAPELERLSMRETKTSEATWTYTDGANNYS